MTLMRVDADEIYLSALRSGKASYPVNVLAVAGFYKLRFPDKNSGWKPVHIAETYEADDDGNPAGDSKFIASVAGQRVAVARIWPYCGRYPISADDHTDMMRAYLTPPDQPAPETEAMNLTMESLESAETDRISAALVKCQAMIPTIQKGHTAKIESTKGKYEYDYADIGDIMDGGVREALEKCELGVRHHPSNGPEGRAEVLTKIFHTSGQWIGCRLGFTINDSRPQALGALVTYLKRYAMVAMLNIAIADDDDDAAGATDDGTKIETGRKATDDAAQAMTWANNLAVAIDRMADLEHLESALAIDQTRAKFERAKREFPDAAAIVTRSAERARKRFKAPAMAEI